MQLGDLVIYHIKIHAFNDLSLCIHMSVTYRITEGVTSARTVRPSVNAVRHTVSSDLLR